MKDYLAFQQLTTYFISVFSLKVRAVERLRENLENTDYKQKHPKS
jgi:hypothetical protein